MARDDDSIRTQLERPQVRLLGRVDGAMVQSLDQQLEAIEDGDQPIVVELTTLGGDAEFGRRAMLAVEEARKRRHPRRLVFLGKTTVYSAGVTLMSGFAREDRYLAPDAVLLIHCRQLEEDVSLSGPLRTSLPKLQAKIHEIETGIALEVQAFEKLIEGSKVEIDMLLEKALHNWYVPAEEAAELGLVGGVT